jgi:recombination protein RecA
MSTNKWMSELTKDFGVIAADLPDPAAKVIKMPSPSLNWAVGNGGLIEGKNVLLFGPESGGKSLILQLIIAEVQKNDPEAIAILCDAEFSFNKTWFAKLGGDNSRLILRQTNDPIKIFDYANMEGEMHEKLQEGAPIKVFAIDSVKSIRYPKDIRETTKMVMGGGGASYLGSALKGVLPVIRQFNVTSLMVQQVYEEMDEYKKMRNPWIIPDGRALKHFNDYMLQVEKIELKKGIIMEGKDMVGSDQQVGHKIRVKCKKNRTGAPYRTAELSLRYDTGIVDVGNELFELAKSLGVIYHPTTERGTVNTQMWQFEDHDPIRGEENVREWVLNDKKIQSEIYDKCISIDNERVIEDRNKMFETTDVDKQFEDTDTEVSLDDA